MPYRPGEHARHGVKFIVNEGNHEATGGRILCAWEDCERDGVSLFVVRIDHGSPGFPRVTRYAFCSERHMEYFKHSHHDNGKLPPGLRNLTRPR